MKKLFLLYLSSVICGSLYCPQEKPASLQECAQRVRETCNNLRDSIAQFKEQPTCNNVEQIVNNTATLVSKIPHFQEQHYTELKSLEHWALRTNHQAYKLRDFLDPEYRKDRRISENGLAFQLARTTEYIEELLAAALTAQECLDALATT